MPGMWEEVYGEKEHDSVPTEKPFGIDRENPVVISIGRRCFREITIRTWLCRSGMQGKKLHERFAAELELVHVQLDEAFGIAKRWANVQKSGQDMWLWVAHVATTKLIPVLQVGGRSQEMAYSVVHELKRRLAADCVPVFSTDGLKQYFYALTAHFGKWEWAGGKKAVWVLLSDFVYSQVIVFA
jgi:hypothetical protein